MMLDKDTVGKSNPTWTGAMASAEPPTFGSLLRRYRRAAGLTQEELAERAGLSVRGISDLERGLSRAPRLFTLRRLADTLQLAAEDRAALQTAAQAGGPVEPHPPAAGQALPLGGFLGSLPSGPLVGRERELQSLVAAVDDAAAGHGRLVMLAGEPGVGKTRLAQEGTLSLIQRDFIVAAGRCYEPERTVPYYPFLEVLNRLYESCPVDLQRAAASRWAYLGRLLPDHPITGPPSGTNLQEDQQRLLRAVTGFLVAVTEISPIAVLLDDLQWADQSSVSLLLHLVRSAHSSRIFVLGTYRDAEVRGEHPLAAALLDLEREQLVERVQLRPLAEHETADLMAAMLGTWISAEFSEMIHRRTEGNPFFVQQLIRALVERGDIYWHEGDWSRLALEEIEPPESVRAVIRQRISRLSTNTQSVLQHAGVLGQTFPFDALSGMRNHHHESGLAAQGEDEVEHALEEAINAGLVHEVGDDAYGFDHVLTQETLYLGLPSRSRAKLHLAAGEALERLPGGKQEGRAAELSRHFHQGRDLRRALRYAIMAGDHAEAVFAHAEAETHYRTALSLVEQTGDVPSEAEALEKLGGVLKTLGRYNESLELLERAAERYAALGDQESKRRSVARIGQVHSSRGSFDAGIARLQAELEGLHDASPSEGLAALNVELAQLFFRTGRYHDQLAVAERACDIARATGSERLLIQAELIRGYGYASTERRAEFRRAMEDVITIGEKIGDLPTVAVALAALVSWFKDRGELEQAMVHAERALEIQERLGDLYGIAFATYVRGLVSYWTGEWDRARADFERSLRLYQDVGSREHSMIPLFGLGMLALGHGDSEVGSAYLEEHIAIARRTGDLRWLHWAEVLLAQRDILEAQVEAAQARLEAVLDWRSLGETDAARVRVALAWACLEVGDDARAAELVADATRVAEARGDRLVMIEALRVQGMIMTQQRRWPEARHSFERVLELTGSTTFPYARARALHAYGDSLLRQGYEGQARARYCEALGIFERLRARKEVERTRRSLAAVDQV